MFLSNYSNETDDMSDRSKRVGCGWTVVAQRSTNCTPPSLLPPDFWSGGPSGPVGWLAGLLLLKAGDVAINPGPKHTRTQVWICDICHR